jgi:TAT (twin-arginine translocation) pathway signal sequence
MMNRRNFLKFIAGTAVVAATGLPESLEAVPITDEEFFGSVIDGDKTVYGMMREIVEYDFFEDRILVRHDVYTGKEQFTVTSVIKENTEAELEKARSVAARLFHDHIVHHGFSVKDLKKFPTIMV